MKNLEILYVSNSEVVNPDEIGNLENVQVLHIENTEIEDISFMKKMKNLSKVGIDKKLYIGCLDVAQELEEKGVAFLENGFVPIVDEMGMKK